jgi:phosphonate transport system ATP-binding protein
MRSIRCKKKGKTTKILSISAKEVDMLRLESVVKRFDTTCAVDAVNLEIPAGQMVGIIGRSGAGKSTLLRLINRLIDPSEGHIYHNDLEVTALRGKALLHWRSQCAMIFQQFNLVNRLNVITNVLVGRLGYHKTLPSLFKQFPRQEKARAIMALARLEIDQQALQRADTLSGGQQQRVAIAKALVQEPKILLADEPIASLDPRSAAKVMDALLSINKEYGITVLVNLHHLDTARSYCERIIGMADGSVIFDGPPDLLTDTRAGKIYGVEGSQDTPDRVLDLEEQHMPDYARMTAIA